MNTEDKLDTLITMAHTMDKKVEVISVQLADLKVDNHDTKKRVKVLEDAHLVQEAQKSMLIKIINNKTFQKTVQGSFILLLVIVVVFRDAILNMVREGIFNG